MSEFAKEEKQLKDTIVKIKDIIKNEKEELKSLYTFPSSDKEKLLRIINETEVHIDNLVESTKNPYFARIVFTADKSVKEDDIYIGKNGVSDDKNNIIIVDWRAPISALYYNADVGRCSYLTPDGIINGNLDLKRQFEIDDGKLINYFDVDLVTSDVLLQKFLNENNDNRLKSIVSTIQREQNEVIRKSISDNIIIQGVAGSGKTTVALHRIAYLVYNYINYVKQEQYLVIGPNPVFLKYIKSVLPDLDVVGVNQLTFEEYASLYINEKIKINSSEEQISKSISGTMNLRNNKFKCSNKYKDMIDLFIKDYINDIMNNDLYLNQYKIIDKKIIQEAFNNTNDSFDYNSRVESTIDKLCSIVQSKKDEFLVNYSEYLYEQYDKANTEKEKLEIRNQSTKERGEINKNCKNILKKYFTNIKNSPTKIYKLFVSNIYNYDIYHYEYLEELQNQTNTNLKKNTYDFEDLSPLIYIKSLISPNKDFSMIKHSVIDEAQDLGEFNFKVLKESLPNSSFSIFGDLAQSIYDYRSIDNWDEVNENVFNKEGEILYFEKSYRTTNEIMDVANSVLDVIGMNGSKVVLRHGEEVELNKVEKNNKSKYIYDKVNELIEKGYKTIAIISKTESLSKELNDSLKDLGLIIPNITLTDDLSSEENYICTISNQLSKGLEFDAVIINDAIEEIYDSNNSLDMKLLFIAITRALHKICIIYTDELTKPLKNYINK